MKGFPFLFKFSYRNLWRAPKRTLIMLLSLILGIGFIIWDLNFANSGSKEVMKEFLSQYAGVYTMTNKNYYHKVNRKEFDIYKVMTDDDIQDKDLLEKSTRRVTAPVFVSGQSKTLGVLLTGIDVDKERLLNKLQGSVNAGNFLNPSGEKEIILGKKLANRINAKIGDEIAVLGQAIDGSIANDLMKVVGLLDFGGGDLEESLAFTQLRTAQDFMTMTPAQYHQRVSFDMENEVLPNVPNLKVTSWTEILPEVSVSVKFIDNFTWVVSLIIVFVLSLGLANTLMITFLEREQEFQSLNVIGAKTTWITLSLMLEVLLLGLISVFFGTILGHALTTYCYYFPINIQLFTGGKPILMGGLVIKPLVRIYPILKYYWQVPLLIFIFLGATMLYPLVRVVRRSKHAV